MDLSGVSTGPLQAGERVTLTDSKGRRKSVVLKDGAIWHTTKGARWTPTGSCVRGCC